jgi:hypothetical protein
MQSDSTPAVGTHGFVTVSRCGFTCFSNPTMTMQILSADDFACCFLDEDFVMSVDWRRENGALKPFISFGETEREGHLKRFTSRPLMEFMETVKTLLDHA